jgi:phosphoglycolate phosphatase
LAPTAKPVVVLFDVDETQVHTGGSGARSWDAAFEKLYGIPADIGAHTSAGETDPHVARATFKGVLDREPSDDELDRLYAQYLLHLAEDIGASEGYRVLPGVEQTLRQLGEAGFLLGLVSHAELTVGQIFVVGDTPRDIDTARAAGAVSVGVASGHYSTEELSDAHPDHVLNS